MVDNQPTRAFSMISIRMRSSLTSPSAFRAGLFAIIVALGGCGGAYGAAISRGDKFAAAGMWDDAAKAYTEAKRIDPTETEARVKLEKARRHQSDKRISAGKSLMARGEIEKGLVALQNASTIDPNNPEAQAALSDANDEAVGIAEKMAGKGEGQKAIDLLALVLKGSPKDSRAKHADDRIRTDLAQAAYTRANDFENRGKLGNALIEFSNCLAFRNDFKDGKIRLGKVKTTLEQEVTFYVVLQRFTGTGSAESVADLLNVDLLSQSFDPKLPVRVVDKHSFSPGKTNVHGVNVLGTFQNYVFKQDKESLSRTCDYKCGEDRSVNPDHERIDRDVTDRERRVSEVETKVSERQREVDRRQKDVDTYQQDVDKQEAELDKKQDELNKCVAGRQPTDAPSSCSTQESNVRTAQSDLDSARSRLVNPKSALDTARRSLQDAQQERETARKEAEDVRARLRTTPRENVVDRMCPHNWTSSMHYVKADVTVWITAEQIEDKVKLFDNQSFSYQTQAKDETFPPQPGRCAEAIDGDSLVLPSEKEMKIGLASQAGNGVSEKILASYERYRARFLADARREEAANAPEAAVEAYVRYLLSSPHSVEAADQKQIFGYLAKTRGFGKIDVLPGH